jgi:CheY-like chemotaxis protein
MSRENAAPIKVLAVDDEESIVTLYTLILGEHGCTVLSAGSGEEAVAVA